MADNGKVLRYHKKKDARLRKRGFRTDGVGNIREDYGIKGMKWGKHKAKEEESSLGRRSANSPIKVNGPKATKQYVEDYFKKFPEVKKEVPKYRGILDNVKHFSERFPNAVNGSYNPLTGKPVKVESGQCVTFHQNYKIGDEYGGYDDEMYASMTAISMHKLKATECYVGVFGNPEFSFNCSDKKTAHEFAIEHNQNSVYDAGKGTTWRNKYWDERTNPIKGEGSNK